MNFQVEIDKENSEDKEQSEDADAGAATEDKERRIATNNHSGGQTNFNRENKYL